MAYFDYSPPQVPDQGEGLKAIGDALTDVLKRRQQQKQFEQEMAQKKEHEERLFNAQQNQYHLQNRAQDRLEGRQVAEGNRQQQIYRAAQEERMRKEIAAGNPENVQAIANATHTYDPLTGADLGAAAVNRPAAADVGPAPEKPVPVEAMPPEIAARRKAQAAAAQAPYRPLTEGAQPEPGAFIGPIPSDEESWRSNAETAPERAATIGQRQAFEQVQGQQLQQQRLQATRDMTAEEQHGMDQRHFDERSANFPGEQAGYEAARAGAEANRPYDITMAPGEQPIHFTPGTQRYGARELAAEDFANSLNGIQMSEKDQHIAGQIYAGIKGGTVDPAKAGAMFQKERMGVSALDQKTSEGGLNRQNRLDVAHINAQRPGLVLQERRFEASQDKDIRKETRHDIEAWLKASGLELAPKSLATLDLAGKQLNGNGREQQSALVQMARVTQGDNRFSDADYRVFVEHGGVGALDQAANTVQQMLDGQFGDQTVAVAKQMNTALRAVFDARLRAAGEQGKTDFVHNEIYDPQVAESVLEQRLGNAYFRRESDRGRAGPPELRRPKGGGGTSKKVILKGGPDDKLEELLKAAAGVQ